MSAGRVAYRVDSNQAEIVAALREIGATVQILAAVGSGCPDILCGYHNRNYLAEIKASPTSPMTADEATWHKRWHGQVSIWYTPEQAVDEVRDDLQEMKY